MEHSLDYWKDKAERTERSLKWALDIIADGCDPEIGDIPPHDCEFESNPEKGHCDFHQEYYDAFDLVNGLV